MNVRDLIEQLKGADQDKEVHFAYDYGDHWHTTVAPNVTEVEDGHVKHSEYHRMDELVDEEKIDELMTVRSVIVLR